MSQKNRTNYSKMNKPQETEVEPIVTEEEVVEQMLGEEVESVEEETEVETVLIGTVNCAKLNMREKPSKNSESIAVLDKDTVVNIYPDKSTTEFYKVVAADGVEGYCMKQFISVA